MAKSKQSSIVTNEKGDAVMRVTAVNLANQQQVSHSTKTPLIVAGSLLVIALAVFAHVRVVSIGIQYTGILAPLDRLFDLLLTFFLIGVTFMVGRVVCRRLSLAFVSVTEEASFSILLGTGIVGTVLFLLGVSHLFRPLPVSLLFVFLIAFTY